MKTRVILFTRKASSDPESAPAIFFARWGKSLLLEIPSQLGVEDFANKLALVRHSRFDYAVGEMGRNATLLECSEPAPHTLAISDSETLQLTWEPFRQTAQALSDGTDRRFLQLAVQFLASGASLDDSVVAADYDAEFLQQLQSTLASQKETPDTAKKD
ncbi:hypothetical protein EBU99_01635 [bacterium]|nr:hypothetical protein [bacterium]